MRLLLTVIGLVIAVRHVPRFYRVRCLSTADSLARPEMTRCWKRHGTRNTLARHEGQWYALLTEEQINGWLAIDLAENHPESLAAGRCRTCAALSSPIARLSPADTSIRDCRRSFPRSSTSIWPSRMSSRCACTARGPAAIPVPITPIMDGIAKAAERLNLRVQWRQIHNDPVALITLPEAHTATTVLKLDALQLRDAAIYLAGRTESVPPSSPEQEPHTGVATLPDENRKVQ